MSTVYSIRWRLVYLDNRELDEPPAGGTILNAWANPVEMHIVDLTGQAVLGIQIPPEHKPIFYRQRSVGVNFANGKNGEVSLDATVFGYGRVGAERIEGKLWMWHRGKAIDCPPEKIDTAAIEHLLSH